MAAPFSPSSCLIISGGVVCLISGVLSPPCRLVACVSVVPSSSRHLVSSVRCLLDSSALPRPSSRHLWQSACLPPCVSSCVPSCVPLLFSLVRPVLPWEDVIAVLPNRSPCRSDCVHQSPCPACRMAGSGTGCFSRYRLVALSLLLARAGCLACVCFPRCGLLCLLGVAVCVGIVSAKLYI